MIWNGLPLWQELNRGCTFQLGDVSKNAYYCQKIAHHNEERVLERKIICWEHILVQCPFELPTLRISSILTHLGGNRLLRGRCILILHPTSIHLQNNSLTFSFSFENKTCAKERFLNQVEERCKRPFGVQMSPRIAVTKWIWTAYAGTPEIWNLSVSALYIGRWMSLGPPFYQIFNPVEDTISQFIWTGNSELQHDYSAQLSWTESWQSTSYQIDCADSKFDSRGAAAAAAALAAPAENQTPIVCWSLSRCRLQASAIFFSRLVLLWNTKKTQNCMAKTNSFGKPEQQRRAMKIPFNC